MGVLDSLKIPRGDRTDWAAKEYLLIDNVSINKTEIDNAKEGQASLLANLNTKYASKSYVQLAIASPNPSEVVVTDLGIATADNTKIGYSLQVNPAGTGLVFANTYKLGNGTLATPALSFSTGVNMGLYASTDTNTEILNFKLNGSAVANITTNTVSGVSTFNLGSIVLSSNGGINSGSISATGNISTTGNIAGVTANVTDVVATGTSSTFAGANVGELNTTGPSIFSGSVKFNYSPNTVYIANTFPYSVNNFISAGYSNVQQAIDCNNSPTFTTSPTTGPRSTGFVQTFIGLDTEVGRATQVFYDGINKRLSMRYYNGTAWDASWVGFAREQGHINNQFFAADATDGKHVVNLGQMNAAISAAAGTGPAGPAGPTGPTGPTGPAGPAGPAGTGGANTVASMNTSTLVSQTNTSFTLTPGESKMMLLVGSGGGGAGETASAVVVGGNGGSTYATATASDSSFTNILFVEAFGGIGGRHLGTSTTSNIATTKHDSGAKSALGQVFATNNHLIVSPVYNSTPSYRRKDPTYSPYSEVFYPIMDIPTTPNAGLGGAGGLDTAEQGGNGGVSLVMLKNNSPTLTITINVVIGSVGSGGSGTTSSGATGSLGIVRTWPTVTL